MSPEGICLGEVGLGGDGLAVFVNRLEQRALPMKSGGLVKGFLMLLSGLRRKHGYYENHNETGKGRRYVGKKANLGPDIYLLRAFMAVFILGGMVGLIPIWHWRWSRKRA